MEKDRGRNMEHGLDGFRLLSERILEEFGDLLIC